MHHRRASRLSWACTVLVLLSGCATGDSTSRVNPTIPSAASSAQLRSGDSLTVTLQGIPDPSINPVQIDDDGSISLPFLGPTAAAGYNAGELAARIRETYIARKFYNAVDVSVTVTERFVYVGGEVMRPGRIIWTPDLTAAKAIQAAGGFTLYAKENRISIVRDRKTYDIDAKLAQRHPEQDPRLVPGDSIQVSRSPF